MGGGNPYRYTGKELETDLDLGLYDFGARWYDPAAGRFTGIDALAEEYYTISSFAYVANNPVKNTDPDGRYIDPGNIRNSPYSKVYSHIRGNTVFKTNTKAYENSKTNHYRLRYGLSEGMNRSRDFGGTFLVSSRRKDYVVGSAFNPNLSTQSEGQFELTQKDIHRAQVLLHESVHAGLLSQDSEYKNLSESEQHEFMASEENRAQIVNGLREFATSAGIEGLEEQDFEAISWAGLEETESFQNLENKDEISARITKLTYNLEKVNSDGTRTVIDNRGNIRN
ncbi:MAG: RHS repeat-associated core domain-containing protein [Bacteroidia bacterium]